MPWLTDWLKISRIGMQMRSAHSRMSLADILSRPAAFDLFRRFKSERTLFVLVGWTFICASDVLLIAITIWGINIAGKFWTDSSKVIKNWFDSTVGFVIDTPFTFRDATDFFPDFREVSSLIVCQVFSVSSWVLDCASLIFFLRVLFFFFLFFTSTVCHSFSGLFAQGPRSGYPGESEMAQAHLYGCVQG